MAARHFVEILIWVPTSDTAWRLDWTLVEIVGDAAATVARESLMDSADRNAPDQRNGTNGRRGRGEVLTVRADRDALQLSTAAPLTFDLSAARAGLEVEVRVANHAGHDWAGRSSSVLPGRARLSGAVTLTAWVGSIGGPTR